MSSSSSKCGQVAVICAPSLSTLVAEQSCKRTRFKAVILKIRYVGRLKETVRFVWSFVDDRRTASDRSTSAVAVVQRVLSTNEARMCVSVGVANAGKTGLCVICKADVFILFLYKSGSSQLESVNIRLETVLAPCLRSSNHR